MSRKEADRERVREEEIEVVFVYWEEVKLKRKDLQTEIDKRKLKKHFKWCFEKQ